MAYALLQEHSCILIALTDIYFGWGMLTLRNLAPSLSLLKLELFWCNCLVITVEKYIRFGWGDFL